MIFFEQGDFYRYLQKIYSPGTPVRIMTFGMYLGISKGRDYTKPYVGSDKRGEVREFKGHPLSVRTFIDAIDRDDLRMIVSIAPFQPCEEGCEACKLQYRKRLRRFRETRLRLDINTRYTGESHMKLYAVGNRVFTGGFNLSNSSWTDAVVEVEDERDKKQMLQVFDAEWEQATNSVLAVAKKVNKGGI